VRRCQPTPQSFANSLSNELLPNQTPKAWAAGVTWMVPIFCLVNSRVGIVGMAIDGQLAAYWATWFHWATWIAGSG
jgi:hypothetical protein